MTGSGVVLSFIPFVAVYLSLIPYAVFRTSSSPAGSHRGPIRKRSTCLLMNRRPTFETSQRVPHGMVLQTIYDDGAGTDWTDFSRQAAQKKRPENEILRMVNLLKRRSVTAKAIELQRGAIKRSLERSVH